MIKFVYERTPKMVKILDRLKYPDSFNGRIVPVELPNVLEEISIKINYAPNKYGLYMGCVVGRVDASSLLWQDLFEGEYKNVEKAFNECQRFIRACYEYEENFEVK